MLETKQIEAILRAYQDETLSLGAQQISITIESTASQIQIQIKLGFVLSPAYAAHLTEALKAKLAEHDTRPVAIDIQFVISEHRVGGGLKGLPGVKNIIAIASGKGGVGKSTVSANVALALAQCGARVGILDADIYGPSQPMMLGLAGSEPTTVDGKKLLPLIGHGLQVMSIGFLVDAQTPMVWRGPMVSSALQQLANDTLWDNLDYLIIDLPPGTGDIQLTLAQKIPVTGAVVVTTPQDIALLDVRRAIGMFAKVKVPVFGVIENMSTYVCTACGHEEAIFGHDGASQLSEEYQVPLLGQIPLARSICMDAERGAPTVISDSDSQITHNYLSIAMKISATLSLQSRDLSRKFPKIVVESA